MYIPDQESLVRDKIFQVECGITGCYIEYDDYEKSPSNQFDVK